MTPWIVVDIGVHVRPIYKPKRIARYETSCFEVSVSEPLIKQPCGVFLLGICLLAVKGRIRIPVCVFQGFVAGQVDRLAACVGLAMTSPRLL